MSYTMSFDASQKCKSKDVKGLLHHVARDADDKTLNHANPNIDDARTSCNKTFYFDQEDEKFKKCSKMEQILDSLDARLKTVEKPLRKDAVVIRPLILQLDPKWYEDGHQSKDNTLQDMLQWAADTFGTENLVGVSMHHDEDAPHMHLLFTPVTEDGRLSQKDWFKSPQALRAMHDDLRNYMNEQGYDVDMERKKPGKHAKRLPEAEYRDFKKLDEERRKLDAQKVAINKRELESFEKAVNLSKREEELDEKAQALSKREDDLKASQDALNALRSDLDDRKAQLDARELNIAQEVNKRVQRRNQAEQVSSNVKKPKYSGFDIDY